jgi:hypothetical protein
MVDKVIVSFVDSMQQNQITLCKKKKIFHSGFTLERKTTQFNRNELEKHVEKEHVVFN